MARNFNFEGIFFIFENFYKERIANAISSYEEDRVITDTATVERIMQFKFLSDIGALHRYIEDKEFRHKMQARVEN